MKVTIKDADNKIYSSQDLKCGEFGLCIGHPSNDNSVYTGTIIIGLDGQDPVIVYSSIESSIGTTFTNWAFQFVKIEVEEIVVKKLH